MENFHTFSSISRNCMPASKVPSPERVNKNPSPTPVEIPPLPSENHSHSIRVSASKKDPNKEGTSAVSVPLPSTFSPTVTVTSPVPSQQVMRSGSKESQVGSLPPPISPPVNSSSPVEAQKCWYYPSPAFPEDAVVSLPVPCNPSLPTTLRDPEPSLDTEKSLAPPPVLQHSHSSSGELEALHGVGGLSPRRSPCVSSPMDPFSLPPPVSGCLSPVAGLTGSGVPASGSGVCSPLSVGTVEQKFTPSPPPTACVSSFPHHIPSVDSHTPVNTTDVEKGSACSFPRYGSNDLIPGGGMDPAGSSLVGRQNIDGYLSVLERQNLIPPIGEIPGRSHEPPGHFPGFSSPSRVLGIPPAPRHLPTFPGDHGRPVNEHPGPFGGEPFPPSFPMRPGGRADLFPGEPDNDLLPPLGGAGSEGDFTRFGFSGSPGRGGGGRWGGGFL